MRRLLLLGSLGIALGGCGDSSGPQPLTLGTYTYSSTVPFLVSDGSLRTSAFAGTFTLTYIAADSIAGTFQVPGFQPTTSLGFKNQDAYLLYVRTSTGTSTIGHRIRPDLGCKARYIPSPVEGTCTLTKQ